MLKHPIVLVAASLLLAACGKPLSLGDAVRACGEKHPEGGAEASACVAESAKITGFNGRPELQEEVTGLITFSGLLCAEAAQISPVAGKVGTYAVTCVEQAGSPKQVVYHLDPVLGSAWEP